MEQVIADRVLNQDTVYELGLKRQERPVKVLQFGEGNFLRGFIDWMIHEMNQKGLFNGNVSVVQPLEHGMIGMMEEQDYLYTLYLRGIQEGEDVVRKEIIDVISRGINVYSDFGDYLKEAENPDLRIIVSNTTEAGIVFKSDDKASDVPPASFPAKLLLLLRKRFDHFNGDPDKGFLHLPCELIDRNGDNLKETLLRLTNLWYPGDKAFKEWILEHNVFFNTLVDRIVSGYPREEAEELCGELGYKDNLIDTGEIFHFLVIEGDESFKKELPLTEAGLDVKWTDDMSPYRTRKVRILNGAHTMTVLAAWLYGLETVKDCMDDPVISAYIRKGIKEEIIPTLDLPAEELESYGNAVLERFSNPYIQHFLLSISLNSVSKFKTRVLPSLLKYAEIKGEVPALLSFSLAALVYFYKGSPRSCDGREYEVNDSPEIVEYFKTLWKEKTLDEIMGDVLSQADFWGMDLNLVTGLKEVTDKSLKAMVEQGMDSALEELVFGARS